MRSENDQKRSDGIVREWLARGREGWFVSLVDVHFLKNENICIHVSQEIYDRSELRATINVPIDHAYGTDRPG